MQPVNESAARFDTNAANYATSEIHRDSPSIALLHDILADRATGSACDVACGAGHLALSFAGRAARIAGVDLSPRMLAAFRDLATTRGIEVETHCAAAEALPFPDGTFDVVASRLAPHHFVGIERAVAEMARVARPGGTVAVIDLEGDSDPEVDALNHALEMLHDPTHVRSYTAARWHELFREAGLRDIRQHVALSEYPAGIPVARWCEITASGIDAERAIRERLGECPPDRLAALGIARRGAEFFLSIRTVLTVGSRPS